MGLFTEKQKQEQNHGKGRELTGTTPSPIDWFTVIL